jgi:alanine transaminase
LTIPGRDGYPASFENIYLSNGASSGVNTLLHTICAKPETGIMVPIPQYPLYTATLSVLDARVVPYYLDEENQWGTSMEAIRTAYDKAMSEGTDVKAICVINPGNPTGASLPAEDIKGVLKFAAEKGLVVLADEVYQTNVFIGEFISFKKALRDLQKSEPGTYDDIELASLHSISKGMVGECGHRGGYFELIGFDAEVAAEVYKFVSIQLCPPVLGQCIVEMMVNPPKEGEPSYELYKKEYDGIFNGLKERAYALYEAFKKMEGVECDKPQVYVSRFNTPTPLMTSPGLHVPLSHHPPPGESHRASQKRRPRARRVLLLPHARRHGCLRRRRLRLWTKGGHAALPHHVPRARHRVDNAADQVPRGVHGRVQIERLRT